MIKQLKKHLKEKKKEWLNILNNHAVTDTEKPLEDYAKGALDAYIEIDEMIDRTERNAKDTEETRRVRELADAQAGLA
ncbi:MAG TPA: hypothetical protein EYN67_03460 [Flavobacteriales bacterium]|nr:hypothetical protein [Flavobacteriales bacterium]